MSAQNRCGDCQHYAVARNPETNRPLPSKYGTCTYPVEWPVVPKAFLPPRGGYCGNRVVQLPQRQDMWKNDTEQCAVFKVAEHTAKVAEQGPLL